MTLGRRQAERNGRAVAGILASRDWRLVASPLGRAVETMRIVLAAAGRPDAPFDLEPALKEVAYGAWEGQTLPEVAVSDPEGFRLRERDKWNFVPPKGESYAMLATRVAAWLATLEAPSLVVAHGGILRVLVHLIANEPAARRAPPRHPAGPHHPLHGRRGLQRLSLTRVRPRA